MGERRGKDEKSEASTDITYNMKSHKYTTDDNMHLHIFNMTNNSLLLFKIIK